MEDVSGLDIPLQICVVGSELFSDPKFMQTCSHFGVPVLQSKSGLEYLEDTSVRTVYIVASFESPEFEKLSESKKHILGPPAVKDLVENDLPLLVKKSPVYCLALYESIIVFSGFKRKADLQRMMKLIQKMGGSINKEVGKRMTQLLAQNSLGEKYQYAQTFCIPVLTEDWLTAAWDNRETVGYRANNRDDQAKYRLPTFKGNSVSFYGFETEEQNHMEEVLVANGGRVSKEVSKDTTHLVVDEQSVEALPEDLDIPAGCQIVKGEWLWYSIQIEAAADVNKYRWRKGEGYSTATLLSPNISAFSPPAQGGTMSPSTSTSNRKRKRMMRAEMIKSLAADSPAHKRRSSVSELLSISGSFLDNTEKDRTLVTPEASPIRGTEVAENKFERDLKKMTARQQVFHEFVNTENNYVAILECISKISSEAEDPSQQGGALLDEQEMKIIFGSLQPILKVHSDMLKKLVEAEANWVENMTIGKIILEFATDLLKAYPPFVNFFENTKNKITEVDKRNPRFHAFLKKCERRPECSRQSLTELMIRPVQRLPSISLLLNDILKHTRKSDPSHPDIDQLEKALAKIKEVMTHLNEEKRRTEGQIHIFDVYSEIENCPASVVSSHRSFVCRADAIEVAAEDSLCGKGYELTLFVFTDIIVVAKRKAAKGMGMMRSPSTASLATGGQPAMLTHKALKFVQMIHLSAIRRLVDIIDQEDCDSSLMSTTSGATNSFMFQTNQNLMAIVCLEDLRERCYTLQLVVDSQEDKWSFLRTVSRHVSNTMCRPDPEQLLVRLSARDMSLDASDLNVSSFSRALSSFHKTKQKVGRAFSFNKTPSKLKRAMSTVMSPMAAGSVKTPSEPFSQMKLEQDVLSPSGSSVTSLMKISPATKSCSSAGGKSPDASSYLGSLKDTVSVYCQGSNSASMENINKKSANNDPEARKTPLTSRTVVAQSCVDLMEAESPRTSRSFPKRFSFLTQDSPRKDPSGTENRDPDFRTPNLCSRPSFREKFRSRPRAGTLGGITRKN